MTTESPTKKCTIGDRYEAEVPDTLDLADRMALAVNALTNVWNPDERWALSFRVDLSRRPPIQRAAHLTDAYLNIPPKFLEALVVCRLASGSTANLDVDAGVIGAQLSFLGADGLTYCPTDTLAFDTNPRGYAEVWGEGRLMLAYTMLAQVDSDPQWVEIGKRKIDRLLGLSRPGEGFRYLWKGRFWPGETVPADVGEPRGGLADGSLLDRYADPKMSIIYSVGALGHGASLFYRVTGYEPALELARGLAHWAKSRVFTAEDGRWDVYHFHHSLYALIAMCSYGLAADDREMLQRVDACYRWAREMGDPLVGFYGECMPGSECYLKRMGNTVEICEVADMVVLALYLTQAGIGDYWDDVDRWVRNLYIEGQLHDASILDRIPESYLNPPAELGPNDNTRNVGARSVGSFFGWMRANDGLNVDQVSENPKIHPSGIMHCCTGNGARTLYHVWDSILKHDENTVTVNLLLNRASPWVDVHSYLPARGKVCFTVKDANALSVRMPEWCAASDVGVHVNGKPRTPSVDGRYVRVDALSRGERVDFDLHVPQRVLHRVIGEIPYKLTLRGSSVVSIDPKGVAYPLYEDQPRGDRVKKTQFVPKIQDVIW